MCQHAWHPLPVCVSICVRLCPCASHTHWEPMEVMKSVDIAASVHARIINIVPGDVYQPIPPAYLLCRSLSHTHTSLMRELYSAHNPISVLEVHTSLPLGTDSLAGLPYAHVGHMCTHFFWHTSPEDMRLRIQNNDESSHSDSSVQMQSLGCVDKACLNDKK